MMILILLNYSDKTNTNQYKENISNALNEKPSYSREADKDEHVHLESKKRLPSHDLSTTIGSAPAKKARKLPDWILNIGTENVNKSPVKVELSDFNIRFTCHRCIFSS